MVCESALRETTHELLSLNECGLAFAEDLAKLNAALLDGGGKLGARGGSDPGRGGGRDGGVELVKRPLGELKTTELLVAVSDA